MTTQHPSASRTRLPILMAAGLFIIAATVTMTSGLPGTTQAQHKWAVGTTFEWEFDFPITTNPAYEAKPAPKRKTRTSANPKAVSSRDRKTPKPATVQSASQKHPRSQRESA